jgi:hypothetical protein
MKRAATIVRSILIYSLILSLSTLGFCSTMATPLFQPSCCKLTKSTPKTGGCCCPNCDGKCGGACCKKNGTHTPLNSAPVRDGSQDHNPVSLIAQTGNPTMGSLDLGGFRHGGTFILDGSQTVDSLQSQHVRIQT